MYNDDTNNDNYNHDNDGASINELPTTSTISKENYPPDHRLKCIVSWNFRWLVTPKLIYFCIGGLYYTFYSFRMKFFKIFLGLPEHISGLLQALMFFTNLLGLASWSRLADRTSRHRLILLVLVASLTIVFQFFWLKPIITNRNSLDLNSSLTNTLILAVPILSLFGWLAGGIMPLTDYQILKLLRDHFKVEDSLYSRQVLWGTVASGMITFGVGSLIDLMGVTVIFFVMPIVGIFAILTLVIAAMPDTGKNDALQDQNKINEASLPAVPPPSRNTITSYRKIILQPHFLLFIGTVFTIGLGRQTATIFLPYYLSEELQLPDGQYGRAYLGSSLISLIPLYAGPILLYRLGSRLMLVIGLLAMCVRLFSYSHLDTTTSWINFQHLILLVELFNGLSFGFTHVAGVKEAIRWTHSGGESTAQAIYTAAYGPFPAILTSIGGGFIYKNYGGRMLFKIVSLLCATLLGLLVIIMMFTLKSSHQRCRICIN